MRPPPLMAVSWVREVEGVGGERERTRKTELVETRMNEYIIYVHPKIEEIT